MEPHEDPRLRLAVLGHPAARAVGSLPVAQTRLAAAVRSFLALMADAGHPGVGPVPGAAAGGGAGPSGWAVPVAADGTGWWLDTDGRWWCRPALAAAVEVTGAVPARAGQLEAFRLGLEHVLAGAGVDR